MTYQLPYRFVERTDELAAFVRDYEATVDSKERAALLTKALVTACQLLSSIDLPILEMELQRIYAEVRLYEREAIRTQTWYEAMFEEPGHFAYFLDNVEAGILCSAGLSQKSCQQILNDLRYLREHAAKSAAEILSLIHI